MTHQLFHARNFIIIFLNSIGSICIKYFYYWWNKPRKNGISILGLRWKSMQESDDVVATLWRLLLLLKERLEIFIFLAVACILFSRIN
jgi:hypothetical protein